MAVRVALPPVVEARRPASARRWRTAPTTRPRTRPGSRKRTSALAGWTLTSTSRRIAFEEQGRHGVPIGRQDVEIGRAQGARQRLVAHRPAVDEDILHERVRPGEGRKPDPPGKAHALARGVEVERVRREFGPERLPEPLRQPRLARRPRPASRSPRRCRLRERSGHWGFQEQGDATPRRPPAPRPGRISGT